MLDKHSTDDTITLTYNSRTRQKFHSYLLEADRGDTEFKTVKYLAQWKCGESTMTYTTSFQSQQELLGSCAQIPYQIYTEASS